MDLFAAWTAMILFIVRTFINALNLYLKMLYICCRSYRYRPLRVWSWTCFAGLWTWTRTFGISLSARFMSNSMLVSGGGGWFCQPVMGGVPSPSS